MRFRAGDLATSLGARLVGDPEVAVDGAGIDSRVVRPGQLFVAVVADRDGHDFVSAATAGGASAAMVERELPADVTQLVVEDTATSLLDAGRVARDAIAGHVVGITGSVGKTTTKDMLASVLERRFRTAASERSLNNELGVPLTLLNAPGGAEMAVVEMGARGAGHISLLCDVARPTVGIVTTVVAAHTEHFGGLEGIAGAKAELVEAVPASGVVVLNAEVPEVSGMAERAGARVLTFGAGGDVLADAVTVGDDLCAGFTLRSPWGSTPVRLSIAGRHHVSNALAAAAAALSVGAVLHEVAEGLAAARVSPWRMEILTTPGGLVVVNDSYNANPASMSAALDALAEMPARRRVAVLGVMAELGADSPALHRDVVEQADALGVEVWAVGCDLYGDRVEQVTRAEVVQRLGEMGEGDAALLKASRVAGLEGIAAALVEEA